MRPKSSDKIGLDLIHWNSILLEENFGGALRDADVGAPFVNRRGLENWEIRLHDRKNLRYRFENCLLFIQPSEFRVRVQGVVVLHVILLLSVGNETRRVEI